MWFRDVSTFSQRVLRDLQGGDRTIASIRSAPTKEHP